MALFGGLFGGGRNVADATLRVNYDGKNAERGLSKLGKTIKTVVTVAAIKQVMQYTAGLAELGARAETVSASFEKFAKQSGRTMNQAMGQLRNATLGMIDDMQLQQNAMKALISGVSFDDMIVAMEYVTRYAATTGTNVTQKMATVMTGFARGSAMFMDDVGIQVMGAADVNAAAIAQMKEKMDDFSVSLEDASVKSANLKASFENLQQNVGKLLVPAFSTLVGWVDKYVDRLVKTTALHKDLITMNKETIRLNYENVEVRTKLAKINKEIDELTETPRTERNIKQKRRLNQLVLERIMFEKKLGKVLEETDKSQKRLAPTAGPSDETAVGPSPKDIDKALKRQEEYSRAIQEDNLKRGEEIFRQAEDERKREQEALIEAGEQAIEQAREEDRIRQEFKRQARALEIGEQVLFYEEQQSLLDKALQRHLISEENYTALSNDITQKREEYKRQQDEQTAQQAQRNAEMTLSTMGQMFGQLSSILKQGAKENKDMAVAAKSMAVMQSIINTSLAVTKVIGQTGVAGFVLGPLMAAMGAAQTAIIASQPAYESGGLIGGRSARRGPDDVDIRAGRGEFVVNSTSTAQHLDVLRSINSGVANLRGGGGTTIIFQEAPVETVSNVLREVERRGVPAVRT